MQNDSFERDSYPGHPRILFVGLGESSHTHSWIDLLKDADLNVRLFSLPDSSPPADWAVRTYVTAYDSPPDDARTRVRLYSANPTTRFVQRNLRRVRGANSPAESAARWLARIVRTWQPDVIHTLGLEPASYFYLDVRKRFGLEGFAKWVVQARGGPDLALNRLLPEYAPRIREVLTHCDQFVADNQQNYDFALECGLGEEKLSPVGVVPGTGGIDVEAMAENWDGPPSSRRVILWPKAYECPQGKALPVFEALKLVAAKLEGFEIEMLAMTAETRMWFETLPEELRRRCRTHDRIPRAGALELMTKARVVLSPALADGIPNSLYEAMAAGAFPIVSPLPTILPIVGAEENVLFARNLFPHEIADALMRALTDDKLVDAAAGRNLALVRRLADRTKIAPRVVTFYKELAASAADRSHARV